MSVRPSQSIYVRKTWKYSLNLWINVQMYIGIYKIVCLNAEVEHGAEYRVKRSKDFSSSSRNSIEE